VKVQLGEKVKGGQTIIAQLKTEAPSLF
jgi:phosphatidylserine decarboxylase